MRNDKTIRRTGLVTAFLLTVGVGACDFIEPTTVNPNAVSEATLDQLLVGVQVNTFFLAEGQLSRISSMWTQQMTGTDRQFATLDSYVFTEEDADFEFSSFYTGGGLIDIQTGIDEAEEAGRTAYAGVFRVMKGLQGGWLASIWGDVPYSEAVEPEIDTPALDEQAAVYDELQSTLDQAIADLTGGTGGPSAADLNYGGDTDAWAAMANTLKARYHMHWAEVNGESAYTAAIMAAEDGISSPANNYYAVFGSSATENNTWYQFLRDRSGYISAGDHLVPLMVDDDDPRLPIYFSQTAEGEYAARASSLSPTGFGAPDFDIPLVTCAENYFIIAEAEYQLDDEPAARAAAETALECQEAEYDVDLSDEIAAINAASGDALLEEIMDQKYIALFLNIETWNDYKRTCLPAITPKSDDGVPARLFYGQTERQANENVPGTAQQPERNDNDPNACV